MQVTLESTTKIVTLNGVPARIWEGHTSKGVPCHACIVRIGVSNDQPSDEFDADLKLCNPPSPEIEAIPARMIL